MRIFDVINLMSNKKWSALKEWTQSIFTLTDAAKGQLNATIKGRSLKQELNYNRDTWAEWTKTAGVVGDSTGLEFTADGISSKTAKLVSNFKPSTKYGLLFYIVNNNTETGLLLSSTNGRPLTGTLPRTVGNNKFVATSVSSITINELLLSNWASDTSGTKIKIRDIRIFELPTGSEIESDFNTMTADQLAQKYPYIKGDTAKSTLSVRLKAPGKNLFDGQIERGTFTVSGQPSDFDAIRTKNYIRVQPSTTYTISNNKGYTNAAIFWYDSNKNFISAAWVPTGTSPTDAYWARFRWIGTDLTALLQLGKGTVATPYEPYTYTEAYTPSDIVLRSVGVAKDELSLTDGKNTQNAKKYVLQASDITNLSTSRTNFDMVVISKKTDMLLYNNQIETLANAQTFTVEGYRPIALGSTDTAGNAGGYSNYSNISFIVCVAKGTYANLAAAQAALTGVSVTYQLAQPIVTTVPVRCFKDGVLTGGLITHGPNTTIMQEPVVTAETTPNASNQIALSIINPIKELVACYRFTGLVWVDCLVDATINISTGVVTINGADISKTYFVAAIIDSSSSTLATISESHLEV